MHLDFYGRVVVPAAYLIGACQDDGPTLAWLDAISIGGTLGSITLAFAFITAIGRWMPDDSWCYGLSIESQSQLERPPCLVVECGYEPTHHDRRITSGERHERVHFIGAVAPTSKI